MRRANAASHELPFAIGLRAAGELQLALYHYVRTLTTDGTIDWLAALPGVELVSRHADEMRLSLGADVDPLAVLDAALALFLLVGVIYEQTHDRQIAHMGGLNARLPHYAAMFGLFTFASIGLPGLSGFVGEFLVILGAFRFNGFVAAATMLVVIASAVYMLWMFQRVFFTVPSDWMRQWWPNLKDLSRNEWIALAPLVVLVVALGVYPGPVLELFEAPIDRIIEAVNGAGLTGLGPLW